MVFQRKFSVNLNLDNDNEQVGKHGSKSKALMHLYKAGKHESNELKHALYLHALLNSSMRGLMLA